MLLLQDVVSAFGAGAVYALVALSLVIVFRATGVINFAAGEIATFTTFVAWELLADIGLGFWLTLAIVMVFSAFVGVLVYVFIMHPALDKPEFVIVMLTFGLFELFNGLSNTFWDPSPRSFPAPVEGPPIVIGSIFITQESIVDVAIALLVMVLLMAVFRFTKLGLGFRATTDNRFAAEVVGIRPWQMYAAGWAMATAMGGVAGMMLANMLALSASMMGNVLVFALVAVIIGGLESPLGAVVGGLLIAVVAGVFSSLSFIGTDLATPLMLVIVIIVLLVRPSGLFGQRKAGLL
jgi:branched-chain amino acid transport system permease protein